MMISILKIGAVYVPIDLNYPETLSRFILSDSKAKVLISQKNSQDVFKDLGLKILLLEDCIKETRNESSAFIHHHNDSSSRIAFILYTSGTTLKPKGVCLTHMGLINRIYWMNQVFAVNKDDRVLHKTSVCFDISLWEIFLPLISGATLVCAGNNIPRSSEELISLVESENITIIHFVPQMLKYFLDTKGVEKCLTLRHVFISGDVFYLDLLQKFYSKFNCDIHNLYGPTEASIDVTHWQCTRDSNLNFVPIGRPISNTQIYLLDQDLKLAPLDHISEIFIGGDCLATGYLNPELTKEYFIIHPKYGRLYCTGDFAKLMPDGNIQFIGRKDRQIKLGGYRIELNAIEEVLNSAPEISSAAVSYKEIIPGFKDLIAYLVTRSSSKEIHINPLKDFLRARLPLYMVPNIFVIVPKLPLTANKKINYQALPIIDNLNKISEEVYIEMS